jgi:hypothetical protein
LHAHRGSLTLARALESLASGSARQVEREGPLLAVPGFKVSDVGRLRLIATLHDPP